MNLRNLKPKLLTVAALALLSSGAHAAVEYSGTPDAQPPLLKTYGVDVPTKSGLKSVLPQGWTLFIHKAVTLPEFMSWTVGAPWTKAVEDIDGHEKMVIRLDWTRKTVTIVPAEAARPIAAVAPAAAPIAKPTVATTATSAPAPSSANAVAEKHQALVAPTLDPAKTAVSAAAPVAAPVIAPVVAAPAIEARPVVQVAQNPVPVQVAPKPATVVTAPLIRTVPTVAPAVAATSVAQVTPVVPVVAAAQVPLYRPVTPVTPVAPIAPHVDANVARAQVGGSARDLVERMASRFNFVLSWEASDVTIPGAVTLLGVDIAEDAKLLQKAIGLSQTPVSIEVYRESSVIRVVPRNVRGQAVALVDGPYSGRIVSTPTARPQAPVQAPRVAVEPVRIASLQSLPGRATPVATDPVAPVVAPVPVVVVTAPAPAKTRVIDSDTGEHLIALNIQKGDSLTNDLRDFFKGQGWELRWTASADLQASYPVTIQETDAKKIMGKLLPKLGLTADFYNPSKLVVIRSTDSSTN